MNFVRQSFEQLQRFPRDKQTELSADAMMRHVCYALLPGVLAQVVLFGVGVLLQIILALLTALCCEALNALLRKRRLNALDLSAGAVTAMLLAVSVPATAPYWLIIIGVGFGLLLGKHAFGGVGMNIFNPALVGFCGVYLSFAVEMSLYPETHVGFADSIALIFSQNTPDGLTGATQLSGLKANGIVTNPTLSHWWINAAWLVGGLYLWAKRIADWRLSLKFMATFIVLTWVFSGFTDTAITTWQHIGLGALVFTGCFIITDPTTAASSRMGRYWYAGLAAVLAVIIRQYSNMPDSMAFAVLLANMVAPMIDSYTRPRYYRG